MRWSKPCFSGASNCWRALLALILPAHRIREHLKPMQQHIEIAVQKCSSGFIGKGDAHTSASKFTQCSQSIKLDHDTLSPVAAFRCRHTSCRRIFCISASTRSSFGRALYSANSSAPVIWTIRRIRPVLAPASVVSTVRATLHNAARARSAHRQHRHRRGVRSWRPPILIRRNIPNAVAPASKCTKTQ
jgi:hypothetical protein